MHPFTRYAPFRVMIAKHSRPCYAVFLSDSDRAAERLQRIFASSACRQVACKHNKIRLLNRNDSLHRRLRHRVEKRRLRIKVLSVNKLYIRKLYNDKRSILTKLQLFLQDIPAPLSHIPSNTITRSKRIQQRTPNTSMSRHTASRPPNKLTSGRSLPLNR